jgi:ABC-type nitrate/sulfonate/bicarbonate transport system substrate-binding protein
MKKTALLAVASLLAATVSTPAPAEAADEKTSISLPALTITFMPVYIAKDLGYWDKLGLDVNIHEIAGMGTTNAMLAGSVDFAVQSGPSLIRGNMRGQKMVGIALMANGVAFEIDANAATAGKLTMAAPFKSRIAALKGKRVSVDSPKTVVEGFLRYLLAKGKMDPDRDVTMVFMQPPQAIAALKSGDLDAAVLNFPWTISAQRQGAVLLATGLSDVPELLPTTATTTTTRPDFCKEHRSICVKLVKGYIRSHAYILDHPDEALDVAKKRMPKANADDIAKSFPQMLKTTPRLPLYEEAYFKHAQQIMLTGGMIRKDDALTSFKELYTNEYVNEAGRAGS